MYAIVDIETTGGSPAAEKITEVAIYLHDGEKIVDEFCTLINPEKKIPYYITNLTGISNAMVSDSPKFYEVAKRIIELTADCVFVAHNVSFDYQFVRNEYKRLGYIYTRDKLCTVQLSRRLIPGQPSYSLGRICRALNIENSARHRASGDALATVRLFEYLLKLNDDKGKNINILTGIDKRNLHPELSENKINQLPEKAGVYYFFNDSNELIYIGKSKNIRNRVLSHFRNNDTKKAIEMRNEIADIDYELTGSELIALLKESHEIKMHKPLFNRSQRRSLSQYGLYHFSDDAGYFCFHLARLSDKKEMPICCFATQKSGKTYIHNMVEEFQLCFKLCGLYPSAGACFHYEIAECKGACIGKESPSEYNERAGKLLAKHRYKHESFFIIDSGRNPDEQAIVKIENGKYIGYGYVENNGHSDAADLGECIRKFDDNRDIQQIIKNYIRKNKHIHVIESLS